MRSLISKLEESSYEAAQKEAEALLATVQEEKTRDFARHDERIRERLRKDIAARFLPDSVQVRASLDRDTQFQEAVDLLQDSATYAGILRVNG